MWYLISIITIAQFIDNDHSAHRSDVSVDLLFDNGISAVSNSLSGQIPNPQSPRPRDKIMERKMTSFTVTALFLQEESFSRGQQIHNLPKWIRQRRPPEDLQYDQSQFVDA